MANPTAEIFALDHSSFCLQPELDQPADGFGAVGLVIFSPLVDRCAEFDRQPHGANRIPPGSWSSAAFFWVYLN
jgi:hypothetical protein